MEVAAAPPSGLLRGASGPGPEELEWEADRGPGLCQWQHSGRPRSLGTQAAHTWGGGRDGHWVLLALLRDQQN